MAWLIQRLFVWLGLDATRQWALFRTRARLTMRTYTRQRGRIVGLLVSVLFFGPLALVAAIGSTIGYWRLPPARAAGLLGIVLVVLWLIWLVAPVLAFRLNEGLDLTRLLVYPLSRRDLVVSTLLGTLLDFPTYLALPLFVAVFLGWAHWWTWPLVLIAVLLSYGHMVIISQLILTAGGGLLRSRRFRDISIVVFSLLGSSCYLLNQGAQMLLRRVNRRQFFNFNPLDYLQWLPTGATARAIERATAQDWTAVLLWLLYATVLLIGLIWLWWRLLDRVVTGAGFLEAPARPKKPNERTAKTGRRVAVLPLRWLPDGIQQLCVKELKAIWRTPQRRIGLLQSIFMPILVGAVILLGRNRPALPTSAWSSLTVLGYALFTTWVLSLNLLGWEGKALPMLLATPIPRHQIFLGKGLALLLVLAVPFTLFAVGLTWLTQSWFGVAGWLAAFGISLATMTITMNTSVFFASPINVESTSRQSAFAGGCTTALANLLLVPALIGLAVLPILALFGAAYWWQQSWLIGVGSVLAVFYGTVLFWIGVYQAARFMLPREAEILEATRQPET